MKTLTLVASVVILTTGSTGAVLSRITSASEVTASETTAWIGSAAAVCGGFIFLARMIWVASKDRASVAADISRSNHILQAITDDLADMERRIDGRMEHHSKKLDCHDKKLSELRESVAGLQGRVDGNQKQMDSAVEAMNDARSAIDVVSRKMVGKL